MKDFVYQYLLGSGPAAQSSATRGTLIFQVFWGRPELGPGYGPGHYRARPGGRIERVPRPAIARKGGVSFEIRTDPGVNLDMFGIPTCSVIEYREVGSLRPVGERGEREMRERVFAILVNEGLDDTPPRRLALHVESGARVAPQQSGCGASPLKGTSRPLSKPLFV